MELSIVRLRRLSHGSSPSAFCTLLSDNQCQDVSLRDRLRLPYCLDTYRSGGRVKARAGARLTVKDATYMPPRRQCFTPCSPWTVLQVVFDTNGGLAVDGRRLLGIAAIQRHWIDDVDLPAVMFPVEAIISEMKTFTAKTPLLITYTRVTVNAYIFHHLRWPDNSRSSDWLTGWVSE